MLTVVTAAGLLAGCGSATKSAGTGTGTAGTGTGTALSAYRVSLVADLTGLDQPVSGQYALGVEAYFSALNKQGGVNGHKVVLSGPYDGQSTPTGSETAVREALAARPEAIVGLVDYLGAAQNLLTSAKVPVLAVQIPTFSWEIGKSQYPWFFSPVGDFTVPLVNGAAKEAGGSLAGKKVDLITYSISTEEAEFAGVTKAVEADGGKIGISKEVDPAQLSFTSEAAAIAADHPSAVIMAMVGAAPKQVTQDLALDGYKGPIISWLPAADPATIEGVGAANYYGERNSLEPTANNVMNVAARAAGLKVSAQSDLSQGWINGAIAATGLSGCTSVCTSAVVEQTLNTKPVSAPGVLFGPIQYSPTDHLGNWSVALYHYDPTTKTTSLATEPYLAPATKAATYFGLAG